MPRLSVLINGAGIAGTSLAFWLSKLGHSVTVVEKHAALRTNGLQLDLRGHGVEVLKRMGLEDAFRSKMAPEQGMQIVDKSGRRRAFFPANKSGKGAQAFTTEYEIMRGDLCRLFYDATKDGVRYRFATFVQHFEQVDAGVEVRFADGESGQFDLLVGADGQWSGTRKMMLGSSATDAFHPLDGLYIGYCTLNQPIQEGEDVSWPPTEVVSREKEAVTEVLQGAGWRAQEVLDALPGSDDFYLECMGLVKLESWSSGRVALVGDAAYCPSIMAGMGTTCAMVGAYVLAGETGKYCGRGDGSTSDGDRGNVEDTLGAYEKKFRPHMDQVQKGISEGGGFDMPPSTPLAISMFHILAGVVSFLRLNVIGEWLMKEKLNWDLPEYEGLDV